MTVDDPPHIGAGPVDFTVDESFEIGATDIAACRLPLKVELDEVLARNAPGRQVSGQEKMVGALRVACAHVAKGIYHPFLEEDVVGLHQLLQRFGLGGDAHLGCRPPGRATEAAARAGRPRSSSAIFSAIIMMGALVGPRTTRGSADPSMTRRPARPRTLRRLSSTALSSHSVPILQVPTGWCSVMAVRRTKASMSASVVCPAPGDNSSAMKGCKGACAPISRMRRMIKRIVRRSLSVAKKFCRMIGGCAGFEERRLIVPRLSGCSITPLMPKASV